MSHPLISTQHAPDSINALPSYHNADTQSILDYAILSQMGDPKDSPLHKAEASAKRVLERLGSTIDKKVLGRTASEFGPDFAGDLASRIEKLIESSLKTDGRGCLIIAPNHYKVALTYEETSGMTQAQIESLSRDLTAAAHEFIHNRRYQTQGPIVVEVVPDLFAASTQIKAGFDKGGAVGGGAAVPSTNTARSGSGKSPEALQTTVANQPAEHRPDHPLQGSCQPSITLASMDGPEYRFDLLPGGAPQYIGRAAGNAARLDDPSVSRIHCSIALRTDGQLVISDLDSANGTFVNGRIVNSGEAQVLEHGDDIRVGDVRLKARRVES
jgi:hypothetical protein